MTNEPINKELLKGMFKAVREHKSTYRFWMTPEGQKLANTVLNPPKRKWFILLLPMQISSKHLTQ